ncbi:Uma2 family endonuclease [Gloeobacter morelensis]|uniref:Uma2 family endonuclease n=1 Tax=Gloeobacter morelensis MG652769 TaxID=2781736 RepID=A0ABY3PQI0_9CYAN|nr:Uma2 family endonuclease [Gloeobacter morelensis]UFP95941.1 Uma2 family endonuclease [Gloeobacter morelensis MG652769]
MIANPQSQPIAPLDYLAWELQQPGRHEYIDGRVLAMTGASAAHNTVLTNLSRELSNHLRATPCRVFTADMKVQITAEGPFFYPDAAVTCSEQDDEATYTLSEPCLIVEVLSPSTEAFDRGAKFAHYRRLSSLQEYVLIDSQSAGVECFRSGPDRERTWILQLYAPDSELFFESIDLKLSIAAIYEKVRFSTA